MSPILGSAKAGDFHLSLSGVTPRQMRAIMITPRVGPTELDDLEAGFDAGAGIEIIAQGVADKIEGQDR